MINIDSFDRITRRYSEYWSRENHDSPLLWLTADKSGGAARQHQPYASLRERWLDTGYQLQYARRVMENTYYAGDSYPLYWPNLGPDIFGAIMGCDIAFGEDTSWAVHPQKELCDYDFSALNRSDFWFKKIVEMTEAAARDARGDYLVGITDLHAGLDGLVSLRGPEELCMDLYADPEAVNVSSFTTLARFKEVYEELCGILARVQRGSSNWMNVYHPEGWFVTSCDFMGMISPEMYKEFVEPELLEEVAFLKNNIFHLDGPGALRHLDALLEIDGIDGIQWVYGAGQPTAAHWVPVLQKIQQAGKVIHVDAVPEDLPVLKQSLKPEGLLLSMQADSVEQAMEIEKQVRNWNRR